MKKFLPYIIGFVALVSLAILLINSARNRPRKMDERVTIKEKDKIPYGFYAARKLTEDFFPKARVFSDLRSPGYWDSLLVTEPRQAVFLTSLNFEADEEEMQNLADFAREGNTVFIIARFLSYDAIKFFDFKNVVVTGTDSGLDGKSDSLKVRLIKPRFADATTYVYPGKKSGNHFTDIDTTKMIVLGQNGQGKPNFIQMRVGEGNIFIHTAPLSFSNYFILHKNNISYFEQVLSVVPANVEKIVWNEFYLQRKTDKPQEKPNWLGVLFQYESFKWALLTAIGALLLYVLLEMRRRQRLIPVLPKLTNDSLDFVQTIGRLYYNQKDHTDLARKLSVYFLDHVRSRYKIPTQELDEQFVHLLHAKSGYAIENIKELVQFAKGAQGDATFNEEQLAYFHQQLEKFYQNT